MSIRCTDCGREYDVTLFEFDKTLRCVCGQEVVREHREQPLMFRHARRREDERVREIGRRADRIAFLIVSTCYPLIDIEIEKQKLQEKIEELFPDKAYLYKLLYEPRFKRLEEQFRRKD